MTELTFRPATDADVDDVLAFWRTAAEDSHRPKDIAEAVVRLIARDPDALLLALDGTTVVGTVIAGWDGWRAHLYRLAVHPDRRRQGIAKELLTRAEERFGRLGAGRIDAMILDDNALAHRAWDAAGYTRQPEWSRWVKPLR